MAEAVTHHTVGIAETAKIGPLEVTETGLVSHFPADLFGKPTTKTTRK
jgi:hypothetical protein